MARKNTIVLPKWVTQIGATAGAFGLALEAVRQATPVDTLPWWFNLGLVAVGGLATMLGAALGDHDSDGIINLIDPDYRTRNSGS